MSRRVLGAVDAVAATGGLFTIAAAGGDHLAPASVLSVPLVVVLSKVLGLYDHDELVLHKTTLYEAPRLVQLAMFYAIAVWLLERIMIVGALEKLQFLGLWVIVFLALLAGRSVVRQLAPRFYPPERCLVVANPETHSRIVEKLELSRPTCTATLVLRVDASPDQIEKLAAGELLEVIESNHIERVILAPGMTESDLVLDLIREAKSLGVKVSLLPRFSEVLGSAMVFDDLHGMTMLSVRRFGLSRSSQLLKRGFDLTVTGLGLVLISPLLLFITIATLLDSAGPIVFRQTRIGRDGKPFEMFKFRTMVCDAEDQKDDLHRLNEARGLFKIEEDPRTTKVGRWLRRTSLDELPQLVNVLRGDMSLVGPRPLVPEEDQQIEGWYRTRLRLAPGMTGHWQVLGSSRVPLHEMVAIDYLYVASWSLWKDIQYLLRTIPHVVAARGM